MEQYELKFADKEEAEEANLVARDALGKYWMVIGDIIRTAAKKGNLLVAKDNSTVVGYVRVIIDSQLDHIHISEIGVSSEYQKKGVGAALLQNLKALRRWLPITVKTDLALDFFKKQGFVDKGTAYSRKSRKPLAVLVYGEIPDKVVKKIIDQYKPNSNVSLRNFGKMRLIEEVFE